MSKPKVLLLDIETKPMLAYVWDLWEQNVGLNMLKEDWSVMAWAAKWLGDPANKIMYQDNRKARNLDDDSKLLRGIWRLLDEADVIVTQNGKRFDEKKLNARFILNGMQPPSSYRHVDTKQIASQKFGFTSNRLEYLSEKLCTKYKKSKHKKYSGFELWSECIKGNQDAWREMERYNKYDVLSLEELYLRLAPWASGKNDVMFQGYSDNIETLVCNCGSKHFHSKGYAYTATGKFLRLVCTKCGKSHKTAKNLLTQEERAKLLRSV